MINHDEPGDFRCFSYIFRSQGACLGWNQQHILCGCGLCILTLLCWGRNPERLPRWVHPSSEHMVVAMETKSLMVVGLMGDSGWLKSGF